MFELMECKIEGCENESRPYMLTCGSDDHTVQDHLDALDYDGSLSHD